MIDIPSSCMTADLAWPPTARYILGSTYLFENCDVANALCRNHYISGPLICRLMLSCKAKMRHNNLAIAAVADEPAH